VDYWEYRTLKLIVVLVVDIAVRAGAAAEEALLVRGLHVHKEIVVIIEAHPAEAAHRVSLEAALCQRPRQITAPHVAVQIGLAVCYLLRDEHLRIQYTQGSIPLALSYVQCETLTS